MCVSACGSECVCAGAMGFGVCVCDPVCVPGRMVYLNVCEHVSARVHLVAGRGGVSTNK